MEKFHVKNSIEYNIFSCNQAHTYRPNCCLVENEGSSFYPQRKESFFLPYLFGRKDGKIGERQYLLFGMQGGRIMNYSDVFYSNMKNGKKKLCVKLKNKLRHVVGST